AIYRNYERLNEPIHAGEAFEGPTLFIRGGNSDYIAEGDRALIAKMFPRATVETVRGAGHWVQADAPVKLTELVLSFLG
ncbi:MAG: alpha/beta hydrolase, partial [Pedosphaera sp.]|nr:alpha/beta hydrolase [Pedosphaera sp.]